MKHHTTAFALAAGMTLAFGAQAAEPQTQTNDATYAGVKVAIDAKTGKLRPMSAVESKRLSDVLLTKRSTSRADQARYGKQPANEREAALTKRIHADGSVSVRVPESTMTEMTATIDANGQTRIAEGGNPVSEAGVIK